MSISASIHLLCSPGRQNSVWSGAWDTMMGGQQLLLQSHHEHQLLLIDCTVDGVWRDEHALSLVMFMAQQAEAVLKSALNCPHSIKIFDHLQTISDTLSTKATVAFSVWDFKTISQMPPVIYKVMIVAGLHLMTMLHALKTWPTCMKTVCGVLEGAGEWACDAWGWTDLLFVLILDNMAATYQKITTLVTENQQRFMLESAVGWICC